MTPERLAEVRKLLIGWSGLWPSPRIEPAIMELLAEVDRLRAELARRPPEIRLSEAELISIKRMLRPLGLSVGDK